MDATENVNIPIIGKEGKVFVKMYNDGTPYHFARDTREIIDTGVTVQAIGYEEAYETAEAWLESGSSYQLKEWKWGYGKVLNQESSVEELLPKYIFNFERIPSEEDTTFYPEEIVSVAGYEE